MRLQIFAALISMIVLQTSTTSVTGPQPIVPRVAFWCGKVNQHVDMVSGEWVTDEDGVSGCVDTSDKIAILRYCQQTYRQITVVNVFEDVEKTVHRWCERGNKNCIYYAMRPTFVCVAGHFEAPRLEVPQGCHFTHLYEPHHCKDKETWQRAAEYQCRRGRQVLHNKGMLVECGPNVYRGVEFVCCPHIEEETTPEALATPVIDEQTFTTAEPLDESEATTRVMKVDHPLVHHALISPKECSRGVLNDQYKTMREEMDNHQKQILREIVGVYRRQKEAADQLKEREPEAAQAMMDTVRENVRARVEAAEMQVSKEHHGLKAQYKDQLARCYEQKMCTAAQMFAVVLHEDRDHAEGIIRHVSGVINRQLAMKYQKVRVQEKHTDSDSVESMREHTVLKQFGRPVDQDLNFTRTFLVLAARLLRGANVQLRDCSLVPPSEHDTPAPESERPSVLDFSRFLEPGPVIMNPIVDDTEAPKTSKPSVSVPDLSVLPGPVIKSHDTEAPLISEQDRSIEPPVSITAVNPTVKEQPEVPETVIDVGKGRPEENHAHGNHHHDDIVDGGYEAPIHHRPEPHKGDISGKVPVFVTGEPEDSIDDKEHLNERSSGSKIYLGVSVGLAGAAALVAVVFLVVYGIRRRYYGDSIKVETTTISDDERSIDDMEAALQDHGFVNPTYKLFDEMDDNQ